MAQYVYTMNRVGKIVPPKHEILRDISLSFFPGANVLLLDEPSNDLDVEPCGRWKKACWHSRVA